MGYPRLVHAAWKSTSGGLLLVDGRKTLAHHRARKLHPVALPQIVAFGPRNASSSPMCVARVLEQRESSLEELHVVFDSQNICILCRGFDSFEGRLSSPHFCFGGQILTNFNLDRQNPENCRGLDLKDPKGTRSTGFVYNAGGCAILQAVHRCCDALRLEPELVWRVYRPRSPRALGWYRACGFQHAPVCRNGALCWDLRRGRVQERGAAPRCQGAVGARLLAGGCCRVEGVPPAARRRA